MENEMYINGELRTTLLQGATIVAFRRTKNDWHVLCRNTVEEMEINNGYQYTIYRTDTLEIFKVDRLTSGSLPTVLKFYDRAIDKLEREESYVD